MMDTISTFFGHYLLVMAIPISVVGLLLPGRLMGDQPIEFTKIIAPYQFLLLFAFSIVAVAGLGMLLYIVNLRLDAMLYARTINGIRKYFYDEGTIDIDAKLRMRGLPQSRQLPSFHERRYFFPVVSVFATIDASYLGLGLWIAGANLWVVLSVFAIFCSLHFVLYRNYAYYREHQYLRSNIIGVDIDGVLNEHVPQFCLFLKKHTGIHIKPDQITVIPVHECEGLGVTRQDEIEVFNDPQYWITMPPVSDSADNLRRIHKSFNMKIHIFTHRPGPIELGMNEAEKRKLRRIWSQKLSSFRKAEVHRAWRQAHSSFRKAEVRHALRQILSLFRKAAIWSCFSWRYTIYMKGITKIWLHKYGFEYHWLMIEKASDETSDPRADVRNRFYESRKQRIRFFVEDDARKATKLAYICDVVFLLDQPYNRDVQGLPNNVIPVESWDEIYKQVRALS